MTASPPTTTTTAHALRWRALGVLLLVQFMLVLDASVVTIALPTVAQDLGFSRSGLAWVVDAYVLTAGGLLLLGGRLGDLVGRLRTFLFGVVVFGVASVVCGAAVSPGMLVGARFVQGAGEALAAPAALGLIALLFTDNAERAKAIGFFGGVSGLAGTTGPILSGLLVEYASWRWIFYLNIPIALVALVAVPRLVGGREAAAPAGGRLDVVGAVLATAGPSGIVYGAISAAAHPWGSARVLVPLLSGIVLLAVFAAYQARADDPLVPLRFFRDRTRTGGNLVTVFFYAVFFTQFFITTLYLQRVLGYSALRAGLTFVPFGLAVGAALGLATNLVPRLGIRPVLTAGMVVALAGALLFTRITADGSYLTQVLPASLVLAFGSGLCLPCLGNAAVTGVTEDDAGLASGLQQALQQVAGAVGLAVLSTLALRHAISAAASGVSPLVATTDGYVIAYQISAVLLALGTVVALLVVPGRSGREASTIEPGRVGPSFSD
jgi:EmrB/QacA subfamily drug resistance transporter